MNLIFFQRGATSWGFQVGRVFMYWPYFRFWKSGSRPNVGIELS